VSVIRSPQRARGVEPLDVRPHLVARAGPGDGHQCVPGEALAGRTAELLAHEDREDLGDVVYVHELGKAGYRLPLAIGHRRSRDDAVRE
jgi:hypothetical protein